MFPSVTLSVMLLIRGNQFSDQLFQQSNCQWSFSSRSVSFPYAHFNLSKLPWRSKSWGRRTQQNELSHPPLSYRACLSLSITIWALGSEGWSCKTRLNSPISATFPSPWLRVEAASPFRNKRAKQRNAALVENWTGRVAVSQGELRAIKPVISPLTYMISKSCVIVREICRKPHGTCCNSHDRALVHHVSLLLTQQRSKSNQGQI